MPQFSPVWWLNLVSWLVCIMSFMIWFYQSISFPTILRLQLARLSLLGSILYAY